MGQRTDWRDENIKVPASDERSWDAGQLPPAQYDNWFYRKVVEDISDLAGTIFVNEVDATSNIRVPAFFGANSSSNITVEVNGAGDLVLAYNAQYNETDDTWYRSESTENNPAMLVKGPSFSGLSLVDSGDVNFENGFVLLEGDSINADEEINWKLSSLNLDNVFVSELKFADTDGDGNYYTISENSSGNLEIKHPELSSPFVFENHSARHENGGADELNVNGLSGDLADAQDPKSHDNTSHSPNMVTTDTTNQTIGGQKEFTDNAPTHPDATASGESATLGQVEEKLNVKYYGTGYTIATANNSDVNATLDVTNEDGINDNARYLWGKINDDPNGLGKLSFQNVGETPYGDPTFIETTTGGKVDIPVLIRLENGKVEYLLEEFNGYSVSFDIIGELYV